jgi:hypothetical protein
LQHRRIVEAKDIPDDETDPNDVADVRRFAVLTHLPLMHPRGKRDGAEDVVMIHLASHRWRHVYNVSGKDRARYKRAATNKNGEECLLLAVCFRN